jgi:hypothetical protein
MDQVEPPDTIVFDRRKIYRPFLERLNPIALSGGTAQRELIVTPKFDPRDPEEPPIHEAFATAAELQTGAQMALVGGIGSGKTTALLLTQERLKRYKDAVNLFIDAVEFTDFSETNPGAMLAAIGLRLFARHRKLFGEPLPLVEAAHEKLRELGLGKTEWYREDPEDHDEGYGYRVNIPGLMKPRYPRLKERVSEVTDLLRTILLPFLEHHRQITVIVDGLDRLIEPVRFREFAEQDLRAVRGLKVTVIVAAPLLLWYDKTRFLQDYFDLVKHIPAAAADPKESGFLKDVLNRRGASQLMSAASMNEICQFSGGVLRDLLALAQSATQYAYRDAQDRIARKHVQAATRQLGNRYLAGLGTMQRRLIQRVQKDKRFSVGDPASRELLVNRQVLEYSKSGHDYFKVHPALAAVLPSSA